MCVVPFQQVGSGLIETGILVVVAVVVAVEVGDEVRDIVAVVVVCVVVCVVVSVVVVYKWSVDSHCCTPTCATTLGTNPQEYEHEPHRMIHIGVSRSFFFCNCNGLYASFR